MKKLIPFLFLICGCTHDTPGYGEIAAKNWAASLGVTDTPVHCIEYQHMITRDEAFAECTVRFGDKLYRVWCAPETRVCTQVKD